MTKKPGFQKPSTSTTATMTAASTPMTPPITASDFLEPSSLPGGAYGYWPNWLGG